jgi:hypothetical protein
MNSYHTSSPIQIWMQQDKTMHLHVQIYEIFQQIYGSAGRSKNINQCPVNRLLYFSRHHRKGNGDHKLPGARAACPLWIQVIRDLGAQR